MTPQHRPPVLIWATAGFGVFFLGVCCLTWTIIILIAALGHGPFTVYGHPATRGQFFASLAPLFLAFGAISALVLAFVLGVRRERPWSRWVATSCAVCLIAVVLVVDLTEKAPADDIVASVVTMALFAGFTAWYFFRKQSVVAYYRELASEPGSPPLVSGPA